ncbi:MAG: hypothetical protein IPK88_03970 [Saprospiraceae bacterium]|nr:hypothetical protein [Candidatus Defluviibacterium haderslevense]
MKKLIFLSILILTSCVDFGPDPVDPNKPLELPPITMEGKNILGCKVNGQVWVSSVPFNLSGYNSFRMGYDSLSGHFGINSLWITPGNEIFENLKFESIVINKLVGDYKILRNINVANFIDVANINYNQYWIDNTPKNKLSITYANKLKNIISGTFEFTAIDTLHNDTLFITEGRFDGKY